MSNIISHVGFRCVHYTSGILPDDFILGVGQMILVLER